MKIVLNIEKRHLIFFGLFLVFVGSVFVIADQQYPAIIGHRELQVDKIYPFTSENDPINIFGNLRIGGNNEEGYWKVGITGNTIMNGDLRVEKKLCDKNNRCIPIEDLINSINDGPEQTNLIFTTIDAILMLKHNTKFLVNDVNTAKQFCKENSGSEDIEIIELSQRVCANLQVAKYQNDNWNDAYNCGNTEKYIKKLKCKGVATEDYAFEDGSLSLPMTPYDRQTGQPITNANYYLKYSQENADLFCIEKLKKKATKFDSREGTPQNCNINIIGNHGQILNNKVVNRWYVTQCSGTPLIDTVTCAG